jgi:uncharacterized protein with HEPN domain
MSRSDTERIADMREAISAIERATRFLEGTTDPAAAEIFVDAITYRLLTIGEAVKGVSDDCRRPVSESGKSSRTRGTLQLP